MKKYIVSFDMQEMKARKLVARVKKLHVVQETVTKEIVLNDDRTNHASLTRLANES